MANAGEVKIGVSFDEKGFDKSKANLTSKIKSIGSTVSGVAKLATATAAAAVVKVGAEIGVLTKKAVDSYAEYEQLAGGVKKLFENASDEVMKNAQNAFKTAGMSANEYMDIATSFAASLRQSTNSASDAAKMTDVAMRSISDNFNTFGGDLENIKNAYRGFAKQNFMMLDNLKLGYGGTRGEMKRLIEDANAYAKSIGQAADMSIENFSDIVRAIDLIQQKQNIAGTTAKEAETTITGSLNAVKAQWKNVLTAFANPDADINSQINSLFKSIETALGNLMPVIQRAFIAIGKSLPKLLSGLQKYILPAIGGLLKNTLGWLLKNIVPLTQATVDIFIQVMDGVVRALPTIIQNFVNALPGLISSVVKAILDLIMVLFQPQNIQVLIQAGMQIILALVDGIIDNIDAIINATFEIIFTIIDVLMDPGTFEKLVSAMLKLMLALAKGIIVAIPMVLAKLGELQVRIIGNIAKLPGRFLQAGKDMVIGLWNGIKSAKDWVISKIQGFGESILNSIKKFFGIASPSRVFRDVVGKNLALGIGVGFTDEMNHVADDMQSSIPTPTVGGWSGALNASLDTTANSSGGGVSIGKQVFEINNEMDADDIGRRMMQSIRRASI